MNSDILKGNSINYVILDPNEEIGMTNLKSVYKITYKEDESFIVGVYKEEYLMDGVKELTLEEIVLDISMKHGNLLGVTVEEIM